MTNRLAGCCLFALAALVPGICCAQSVAGDKANPKPNKYGSPLDTFRNTHLWTDVPPAQDFVKATRPQTSSLRYTPLTGVDPLRPKPRDAANVQALQTEMERFGVENEAKAQGLRGSKPTAKKTAKSKAATVTR